MDDISCSVSIFASYSLHGDSHVRFGCLKNKTCALTLDNWITGLNPMVSRVELIHAKFVPTW